MVAAPLAPPRQMIGLSKRRPQPNSATLTGCSVRTTHRAEHARRRAETSVLGQLLPIKLGAYEVALEGKVNVLRKLETEAFGRFLYLLMSLSRTISSTRRTASFFVTLAAYAVMLARGVTFRRWMSGKFSHE
ncbi:hypothetical protein B0H13DRAFT_2323495 [Mycena leptocephala]|nr:hypothetical protein B0H13DRAFT_2323495 [Mycena leptocephala]